MKQNFKHYTTLESICAELGIEPKLPFDVSMLTPEQQKYQESCYWLPIITNFFNEDKPLDYRRGNRQPKWYIWPDVEASDELPSGVGLSGPGARYDRESSRVGSRLCFLQEEHARHAFASFPELYLNWHVRINK